LQLSDCNEMYGIGTAGNIDPDALYLKELGTSKAKCQFFSSEFSRDSIDQLLSLSRLQFTPVMIVMLREPVSRALSRGRQVIGKGTHHSLDDFVTHGNAAVNIVANELGGGSIFEAKRMIRNEMSFVGLVEYYEESICLLNWQLGTFDKEKCSCEAIHNARNNADGVHIGGYHTNEYPVSFEALKTLQFELRSDIDIYNYAYQLFVSRVRAMERDVNMPVLCQKLCASVPPLNVKK